MITRKLLLAIVAMLLPLWAMAQIVEIDDLRYKLNSQTQEALVVGKYNGIPDEHYYNGCVYSGDIVIPNSIVYNDIEYDVTAIDGMAFYMGGGITSISIPNSVKSIGGSAFQYCQVLQTLSLPSNLSFIGDEAFWGCRGLISVTCYGAPESGGNNVFAACDKLEEIVWDGEKATPLFGFSPIRKLNLTI